MEKQEFGRKVGFLLRAIKHLGATWEEFKWEDDFSVEFTLDNDVVVCAYEQDGKLMYDVGYINVSGGSYMEPPEYNYVPVLKSANMHLIIVEAFLIPKRWELEGVLENFCMNQESRKYTSKIFV